MDEDKANNSIWLYTHWNGDSLPEDLLRALSRRERWNDPSYLARIIFSKMIENDLKEATGYGISLSRVDYNYPDIEIGLSYYPEKHYIRIGNKKWPNYNAFLEEDLETIYKFYYGDD
jgi:hypothetical protein